jgi:O-methyltransferase domain/Dimerisation domain
MASSEVSPEKIMQLTGGAQATAVLGTAVSLELFTRLEAGPMTPDELATAAKISPRGARALLDGVVGLGLVTVAEGRYANSPEASTFLVEGKPASLTGLARVALGGISGWAKLPEAVATGAPVMPEPTDTKDLAFWSVLVPAIAPLAFPCAQAVARRLDVARRGPLSILDVGGGSGIYSAVLLGANREARATQVDWPTVNQIARSIVSRFGVGERFHTIDGDIHTTDWGTGHDVAIYSNIAHQESPAQNVEAFRKFRAALNVAGTLVVSDFVVRDDRSGPPQALLFHGQMLIASREGATWREADYRGWLREAGFGEITFEPTQGASTLIYASR